MKNTYNQDYDLSDLQLNYSLAHNPINEYPAFSLEVHTPYNANLIADAI